ncbi:unnamed protein product [Rotaria sp. Silwood2]|nr:unnamed protein product [Rotaria sp. Silwood2]
MYDSGVDTIDDCTIIYAGMSSDNKTKEARGVTIFLDRQATGAWKNLESIWEASILQNITPPTIPITEQIRQDEVPSLNEVKEANNKMKSGKVPGIDGVSVDLLKAGGEPIAIWLHEIIVEIWENEEKVEDWTIAILIRIYKNKGDKKICDNYRGISVLVAASKVFSRIILNLGQDLIDHQLLEQQAGFLTFSEETRQNHNAINVMDNFVLTE